MAKRGVPKAAKRLRAHRQRILSKLDKNKGKFEDPFRIIGEIPPGFVYQWVALSVMGSEAIAAPGLARMKIDGWREVPSSRHPKMRKKGRRIIVGDQVLMERPSEMTDDARKEEIDLATEWAKRDKPSAAGQNYFDSASTRSGFGYPTQKQIDEVAAGLETVNGRQYAKFTAEIGIVLTPREVEAACVLGLDVNEYARRRFLMSAQALHRISNLSLNENRPVFELIILKGEPEL